MKFFYRKYLKKDLTEAFPQGHYVGIAWIPISLSFNSNETPRIVSLVDSGADYTIFRKDIADALGIDYKSGKHHVVYGMGGGKADVWFHTVNIHIRKWEYSSYVGFTDNHNLPLNGILGYIGFFDRFVVKLHDNRDKIVVRKSKVRLN